jgi:metal-sulfur cluster biosynthetic enzyme
MRPHVYLYTKAAWRGEIDWRAHDFAPIASAMLTEAEIYEVLSECFDPEIPVNIVDLGLIYGVNLDGDVVTVRMTLTARGCSMGDLIATEIEEKLLGLPDCNRAVVEIVWEPAWTPQRMSAAARKQLSLDD